MAESDNELATSDSIRKAFIDNPLMDVELKGMLSKLLREHGYTVVPGVLAEVVLALSGETVPPKNPT